MEGFDPAQNNNPVPNSNPAPNNPVPKKKKHGCLISFIVIIAITVVVGAFASQNIPTTGKGASSSASDSSSNVKDAPVKIGTAISNDDVSIKVNSVQEASSIPDQTGLLEYTPDEGGKYVVVNITVKNEGKELYSFVITNFQMKGKDDTTYSPSILISKDYLNSGSLNPGLSETGNIAFQIPENVKLSDLTLEFQKFLSFNKADFSLTEE